ncbi:MAG: NAD(P)/FAD-dependent oxidoreductase [Saprospiraceae bacterium]
MHIAIIGNGISGITAARYIRKLSDHKITVISSESDHFFSRTALMYIYMGHMRFEDTKPYEDWFWEKNRIELKKGFVEKVNHQSNELLFDGGEKMKYDKLILATGSASNKFGWPGQDLEAVHGMYSIQDLEAMEKYSDGLERAVIVGGGLIGIEMAEMFHSRNIPVTFLVRETDFWNGVLPIEESKMVGRHIFENHIDLQLGTELKEIIDDGNGKACAVVTSKGERIECGFVGLTAGVHPNINFLKESGIEIQRGIVVNEFLETNIPNIYAIGDCAQMTNPKPGRRPVEAIWYTGRMMGETVAYNVCGKKVGYDPGIWFNSAKFFEIEYQVYGTVMAKMADDHEAIYWEHADGRKSIRVIYDKNTEEIVGFNLMGVRFRHEVCEKWLKEKTNVEVVLQDLAISNFDPEFYKTHEHEVLKIYNQKSGKKLTPKKKRGWTQAFNFLQS